MDLDDETIQMLYDKYSVYYDDNQQAWVRHNGSSNKDYDLGSITKIITGENILEKNNSFIDEKESGYEGNVCVCGCNKCKILYKLYHTKTKNAFMVGSSCIVKGDHLEFIGDMICAEKNGRCKECNIPLRYKGKRKNSKKKYNGICEDCRVEIVIFLKISYSEKDEYKKYGTKWNPNLKCWYWKGYEGEFPKQLKPKYWYKTIITNDDFRSDTDEEEVANSLFAYEFI